jgi:uncharacterized protein
MGCRFGLSARPGSMIEEHFVPRVMAQSKNQFGHKSRAQQSSSAYPTVSGRWLLAALGLSLPGAFLCTWAVFCLLFWQGSWQLLYHPASTVAHTPASVGLAFDPVSFATGNSGVAQLQGWWIPSNSARYTALYLHDQSGNLGDTLPTLTALHASGLNVLAFDYRGYGQSRFVHPSEASWLQDATWALDYLTGTRHIDVHSVVIVGSGLGADLALELAAAHSDSRAVVVHFPIYAPANTIFNDPRAKFVPAPLLVRDRYDLAASASALRVPSLWLTREDATQQAIDSIYQQVKAPKTRVVLRGDETMAKSLQRWLSNLGNK